jgi:GST-like protein
MIDLYYWPTPNGHKISIMLEELGCAYALRPINILKGEQFEPGFLAINPNNKIPAIIDSDGPGGQPITLFESGAILIYLAEKTGRFIGTDARARYEVLQWLTFQLAGVGPMFGQCGHFLGYAPEPIPYAIDRYKNETLRLYRVMDRRLSQVEFLAGDYSIADIATWPWIHVRWLHQIDIDTFPNVKRWYEQIAARPAVIRGAAVLADQMKIGNPDPKTFEVFFGKSQLDQSL